MAGKLVINKVTDRNEWRMHLDLLRSNFGKVRDQKSMVKVSLEKIAEEIERKVGKIQSSQNILNNAVSDFF